MKTSMILEQHDLEAIEKHGISEADAAYQLDLFKNPPPYAALDRACLPNDGIQVLGDKDKSDAILHFNYAAAGNRFQKFVPASGAASRMFQSLLWFLHRDETETREEIERGATEAKEHDSNLLAFMNGIAQFAFAGDLDKALSGELPRLADQFDYKSILGALLNEDALNYAALPKGAIPFHRYDGEVRTPIEEHMQEALVHANNADRTCHVHFTVSPAHLPLFQEITERAQNHLRAQHVTFDTSFSVQKPETDTIAVDANNALFRNADGTPLFRPGGHGALIENLNDMHGDLVFIKNIDNVSPLQLTPQYIEWKRFLAGHLVKLQERVFHYVTQLSGGIENTSLLDEALEFMRTDLNVVPPELESDDSKRRFLLDKLQRPIRVCGMVRSEGNPGGGPFWVTESDGSQSIQIVETAQIDPNDDEQQAILASATHFNPVDLVCGVRDYLGHPFQLRNYIDPNAVFISRKSKDGKELKALERPGLWNGAMANWNTVFVEVPAETFSPVKKVVDLLSDVHQNQG